MTADAPLSVQGGLRYEPPDQMEIFHLYSFSIPEYRVFQPLVPVKTVKCSFD